MTLSTRRCTTSHSLGFWLRKSEEKKAETVQRAIVRKMADEPRMTRYACPAGKCSPSAIIMRRHRIEAAPEYLRVALGLVRYHSGDRVRLCIRPKSTGHLTSLICSEILQRLYITAWSVLPPIKAPSFAAGHWIVAVQGPDHKHFAINDDTVRKEIGSYMPLNPHDGSEATVLMYKRARLSR
jgi:hypothetical protein